MRAAPKSVFICHCGDDERFVRRLAKELGRFGIGAWIGGEEVGVGESLASAIEQAIERSSFLVVVLSPAALKRRWVKHELKIAVQREVELDRPFILPALLKDSSLPVFLRQKKFADFRHRFSAGLMELLKILQPEPAIALETVRCSILLDILRVDGSLALYEKTQTCRALADDVGAYTEATSRSVLPNSSMTT